MAHMDILHIEIGQDETVQQREAQHGCEQDLQDGKKD
jgi:hypothetical protein